MAKEEFEDIEGNEEEAGPARNLAPIIIGVWAVIALGLVGIFIFVINSNPTSSIPAQGQSDVNLKLYQERLARNPKDVDALMSIGHSLATADKPVEAIVYFQRILAIRPDDSDALVDVAASQMDIGKNDEALANLDRALKISPQYDYALFVKADYLLNVKNDFQGALDILRALEKTLPPGDKVTAVQQKISSVEQARKQSGAATAPANP